MEKETTYSIDYDDKTGLYKLSVYSEGELDSEYYDLGSIEEVNDTLQTDHAISLSEDEIATMAIANGIVSGDYSDDDEDSGEWFFGTLKSFGELYDDDEMEYD